MPKLDVDVVLLPDLLTAEQVHARSIAVFDVLRATTTLTTALAAGLTDIRLYPTLDAARAGRAASKSGLLLGEHKCLKPDDFDLGNSPGQFQDMPHLTGQSAHMATTNGTRALLRPFALATPAQVLPACLLNRRAIAQHLTHGPAQVTLLCAGTEGQVSFEDLLGCGAVLDALVPLESLGRVNDAGLMAMGTWTWSAAGLLRSPDNALPVGLKLAAGARNLYAAGLGQDVAFAARVDVLDVIGIARPHADTARVTRLP